MDSKKAILQRLIDADMTQKLSLKLMEPIYREQIQKLRYSLEKSTHRASIYKEKLEKIKRLRNEGKVKVMDGSDADIQRESSQIRFKLEQTELELNKYQKSTQKLETQIAELYEKNEDLRDNVDRIICSDGDENSDEDLVNKLADKVKKIRNAYTALKAK